MCIETCGDRKSVIVTACDIIGLLNDQVILKTVNIFGFISALEGLVRICAVDCRLVFLNC